MENIKCCPFQKIEYHPVTGRMIPTLYSDIVAEYELMYGSVWEIFDHNIVISVDLDPTDDEHDIINFMNIVMGNPDVRAIIVNWEESTSRLMSYVNDVVLNDADDDFSTSHKESEFTNIYFRKPSVYEQYLKLKTSVINSFMTRLKWNNVKDKDDSYIKLEWDDNEGSVVRVIFTDPDCQVRKCMVSLIINKDKPLSIGIRGDDVLKYDRKLCKKEDSWLTEIQRYFMNDLNQIIEYFQHHFVNDCSEEDQK